MQSYNFKRVYHPPLGKFVYKHKGTGLIVDNIFKPLSKVVSKVKPLAAVLKPLAKKALKSPKVEQSGKKAGDFLMKRLHGSTKPNRKGPSPKVKPSTFGEQEDYRTLFSID